MGKRTHGFVEAFEIIVGSRTPVPRAPHQRLAWNNPLTHDRRASVDRSIVPVHPLGGRKGRPTTAGTDPTSEKNSFLRRPSGRWRRSTLRRGRCRRRVHRMGEQRDAIGVISHQMSAGDIGGNRGSSLNKTTPAETGDGFNGPSPSPATIPSTSTRCDRCGVSAMRSVRTSEPENPRHVEGQPVAE